MNDPLKTLESILEENNKKLSDLLKEAEIIKKNNEHLAYSISLIKPQFNHDGSNVKVYHTILHDAAETGKKTLRSVVLEITKDGKPITVGEAWERVTEQKINTTRATVNATLHNLVKRGDLIQPETGVYKKAE